MNRRGFFGRMLGAMAAATLAPKLIETPKAESGGFIGYVSHDTLTGAPFSITTTNGWGSCSSVLKEGDVFTIEGQFLPNHPGRLQEFTARVR